MISKLLHYLRLPLAFSSLSVIVVCALLLTFADHAHLYGIPFLAIALSWFAKYSFALLDHVVEGHSEPPVMSAEMVNPVQQRPLGMLAIVAILFGITLWLEAWLPGWTVLALRVGLLALLPAMVGVVSISGRLLEAVNPVAVFALIARMPLAYLQVLLAVGALWVLFPLSMHGVAVGYEPTPEKILTYGIFAGAAPPFLQKLLLLYVWLAMMACIGGAIYEQRNELGFEPARSPERAAAKQERERDSDRNRWLDSVFAEVRGGALQNAGDRIRELIENSPSPLVECRWLYERACAWPDQRFAGYIAELTLPRLLAARATGEALDLVRDRLRHDPSFRPATAAETLQLAALASDGGDRVAARALLEDFELRFSKAPLVERAAQLRNRLRR